MVKWWYVFLLIDRPGLRNPELVHKMQTKLKQVFNNILLPQHPDQATIFSELMTMVHDLRTLNTLHLEKFLQKMNVSSDDSVDQSMRQQENGDKRKAVRLNAEQVGIIFKIGCLYLSIYYIYKHLEF